MKFTEIKTSKSDSTEKTTVTASAAENTATDQGYSVDQVLDFMGQGREMPDVETPKPNTGTDGPKPDVDAGDASDDGVKDAEDKNRSWFDRMFGGRKDGPGVDEADTEMDDEMYQLSGGLGAEISDEALPRLISVMNDDSDHRKYKVSTDEKSRLARAWEIYLRSLKKRITPLQYLIGVHATIYGARLLGAFFSWFSRVQLYGFHWPWSEKWKIKAAKLAEKLEVVHSNMHPGTGAAEEETAAAPPPKQGVETASGPEPDNSNMEECLYWQLKNGDGVETPQYFKKGQGFPKSSKNHKDLIGKFSSHGAFISYLNATNILGRQK